jgi:hypothetical protein
MGHAFIMRMIPPRAIGRAIGRAGDAAFTRQGQFGQVDEAGQ